MKKLLLITALMCTGAHAQFKTGNELLADMQDSVSFRNGVSIGYIMGVADAGNGSTFCLPSNVSAGQLNDMVRNALIETPAVRHLHASSMIDFILNRTWPCAKKRGGV